MVSFCLSRGIEKSNITIITDCVLNETFNEFNCKNVQYPNYNFVCSEIINFIENTSRGIDENTEKFGLYEPEILFYISSHGENIKIDIPEVRDEQAIILTDDSGFNLYYLTTKDFFNIIFGRFFISHEGLISIPIYKKNEQYINYGVHFKKTIQYEPEILKIQLKKINRNGFNSPSVLITSSPELQPIRRTYLSSRGLPPLSKVLFVIDTCHSGYMTHFPFIYNKDKNQLNQSSYYNIYVNHVDMPYCVCISSCEANKTTKTTYSGSLLTQAIYRNLLKLDTNCNIGQLYYHLLKNLNIFFSTINPVISTTDINTEKIIPFFSKNEIDEIEIIDK